jgi:imidazolonepropionase-like amidohydrolase
MLLPTITCALVSFLAAAAPPPFDDPTPDPTPVEEPEEPVEVAPALPVVLIRAHEVYVKPGETLEDASVLVRGDEIIAVGKDLEAPEGARIIEGETVCAGYIDPWSSLGLDPSSVGDLGTGASTASALAVDSFGQIRYREAARDSGVLIVRSQVGGRAYIGGIGAALSTAPGGDIVLEDACLQFTCGSGRPGAGDLFDRVAEVDRVGSTLASGLKYRESQNEYRYDLEEWQKQIAEEEAELEKDFKKAKKDRDKDIAKAKDKGKEFKEKKYKEDKKPKKPKFDADKEVLARAANGELPVVVQVNGGPEIRALLAATADLGRLRLVLSGARGVLPFAEELADRGIAVILTPTLAASGHDKRADLAGALAEKGVRVLVGTGGGLNHARDLPILTQRAMAAGLTATQALDAVTLGPAEAFDLADRYGSIEVGKKAELLVLDGAPLTGKPKVVLTGGEVVEL